MLECRGLRKQFGERVAVDDVSFHVKDNECYGLLGPNGAGKTTTISILCGLMEPDAGTVHVNGFAGGTLDAKGSLGYVPQDIALYPDLSARENLEFFGQLYGLKGRRLRERVDETLELVGLADRGADKIGTYSGGMKRRANIAAGLLHQPQLLVLDEPTVGVDPQSRNAILETVGTLGIAVLYTTHYMEEAAKLCDRVGIINDGRLIAEGTPSELTRSHGGHDRVRVSGAGRGLGALHNACTGLGAVVEARAVENGLELTTLDGASVLPDLVELAGRLGVQLTSIEVLAPDLEVVFLALTGKELRD